MYRVRDKTSDYADESQFQSLPYAVWGIGISAWLKICR